MWRRRGLPSGRSPAAAGACRASRCAGSRWPRPIVPHWRRASGRPISRRHRGSSLGSGAGFAVRCVAVRCCLAAWSGLAARRHPVGGRCALGHRAPVVLPGAFGSLRAPPGAPHPAHFAASWGSPHAAESLPVSELLGPRAARSVGTASLSGGRAHGSGTQALPKEHRFPLYPPLSPLYSVVFSSRTA